MSIHRISTGYQVRYRHGSKNRARNFQKRSLAAKFDERMREQRQMGGIDYLASERLFEDVVQEFWASYRNTIAGETRKRNSRYMDGMRERWEGYRLCDLTAPEVEAYRLELEEKYKDKPNKGAPTIRHILFLLSKLFRHCIRMGYQQANPVQAIDKPSAPRSRLIQPFPPERVEAVRGWFLERGKLEDATLISVLAYAGPRPAEAYEHLTWADVGEQIIFRGEKTGKDRSTRLLEPLREDLRALRGLIGVGRSSSGKHAPESLKSGEAAIPGEPTNVIKFSRNPIFGWSTTRFNSWRDDGAWRKMVDDLDLLIAGKRARPYDLRHAFATLLLGEGTRLPELADQMGNSLAVCQRWYAHLDNIGEQQGASERVWAARKQTTVKEAAHG